MTRYSLFPHPDTPPSIHRTLTVELVASDHCDFLLCFAVTPGAGIVLPDWSSPQRADGLWNTTCFELFLRPAGEDAYFEFNASPSTEWAAYAFETYRAGMRPLQVAVSPHIKFDLGDNQFVLEADIDFGDIPSKALKAGISAVIEETDGTKSYWALAHPPGKPDFHHPDCFVLELPPAPDT